MKNQNQEEVPLMLIERNPLLIILMAVTAGIIAFASWQLLKDVNPVGFLVMVPAAAIAFQALWMVLHPFALVFDNRIEFKQSFFHQKHRYFGDIKKVSQGKNGKFYITYTDDEVERLNLFGIRGSQVPTLKEQMQKQVTEILNARP